MTNTDPSNVTPADAHDGGDLPHNDPTGINPSDDKPSDSDTSDGNPTDGRSQGSNPDDFSTGDFDPDAFFESLMEGREAFPGAIEEFSDQFLGTFLIEDDQSSDMPVQADGQTQSEPGNPLANDESLTAEERAGRELERKKFDIMCHVLEHADPFDLISAGAPRNEYDDDAAVLVCCIAADATLDEIIATMTAILRVICDATADQCASIARTLFDEWAKAGVPDLKETGLTPVETMLECIDYETKRINDDLDQDDGTDDSGDGNADDNVGHDDGHDDDHDDDDDTGEEGTSGNGTDTATDVDSTGDEYRNARSRKSVKPLIHPHLVLKICAGGVNDEPESSEYASFRDLFEYGPDYGFRVGAFMNGADDGSRSE